MNCSRRYSIDRKLGVIVQSKFTTLKFLTLVVTLIYSINFQTVSAWRSEAVTGDTPVITAVGGHVACAIDENKVASCWGPKYVANQEGIATNGPQVALVPLDLGPVIDISVGTKYEPICAVLVSGKVRCWSDISKLGLTIEPGTLNFSKVVVGVSQICTINLASQVECWQHGVGVGRKVDSVPSNLGTVRRLALGRLHACAIKIDDTVQCWGDNTDGQVSVPANLGKVTDLDAESDRTCAVNLSGQIICWGFWGYTDKVPLDFPPVASISLPDESSDICYLFLTGEYDCFHYNFGFNSLPMADVQEVFAGYYYICVATKELVRCFADGSLRQWQLDEMIPSQFRIRALGRPKALSVIGISSTQIQAKTTDKWAYGDGKRKIVLSDAISGKALCRVDLSENERACSFRGKTGQTYHFLTHQENERGKSIFQKTNSLKFCWWDTETVDVSGSPAAPRPNANFKLTVRLRNLCAPIPTSLEMRLMPRGGKWSSWRTLTVANGKFESNQSFPANTFIQIKGVIDKKSRLVTQEFVVQPKISSTLTKNPTLIKGGFSQGGTIYVKVSADRAYSGLCLASASTDNAFNFALKRIGRESVVLPIVVKKGYGQIPLKVRWNGIFEVSVECKSSLFPNSDYSTEKTLLFKANF